MDDDLTWKACPKNENAFIIYSLPCWKSGEVLTPQNISGTLQQCNILLKTEVDTDLF